MRGHFSQAAHTIMTVGMMGETAVARLTAGACTPGVKASLDEKAAATSSRRMNTMRMKTKTRT